MIWYSILQLNLSSTLSLEPRAKVGRFVLHRALDRLCEYRHSCTLGSAGNPCSLRICEGCEAMEAYIE